MKASSIGMNAKSAIHPNQVDTINNVFMPSQKLIDWALRVEEATERAKKNNIGVFALDGKMVDKPVMERAYKILEKARKYGAL